MKLHDNMSFDEKREAGLPLHEGTAVIDFSAYGANKSDVKMQFAQTLSDMGAAEFLELLDSEDFSISTDIVDD